MIAFGQTLGADGIRGGTAEEGVVQASAFGRWRHDPIQPRRTKAERVDERGLVLPKCVQCGIHARGADETAPIAIAVANREPAQILDRSFGRLGRENLDERRHTGTADT